MKVLVSLIAMLGIWLIYPVSVHAEPVSNMKGDQLKPYTRATRHMSLPGYHRWQVFQETGKWI